MCMLYAHFMQCLQSSNGACGEQVELPGSNTTWIPAGTPTVLFRAEQTSKFD